MATIPGGVTNDPTAIPTLPTPNMTPTQYSSALGGSIGTGNTNFTGNGNTANTYTPGQMNLQGLLPGMLSSILQGNNIPETFTAPQQVFDVANRNFEQYVKPGIALQYGAGSPQIGGQQTQMNESLAANLYQTGVSNYSNALNQATGLAFTPTGATNSSNSNQGTNNANIAGSTTVSGMSGTLLQLLKKNMGLT